MAVQPRPSKLHSPWWHSFVENAGFNLFYCSGSVYADEIKNNVQLTQSGIIHFFLLCIFKDFTYFFFCQLVNWQWSVLTAIWCSCHLSVCILIFFIHWHGIVIFYWPSVQGKRYLCDFAWWMIKVNERLHNENMTMQVFCVSHCWRAFFVSCVMLAISSFLVCIQALRSVINELIEGCSCIRNSVLIKTYDLWGLTTKFPDEFEEMVPCKFWVKVCASFKVICARLLMLTLLPCLNALSGLTELLQSVLSG